MTWSMVMAAARPWTYWFAPVFLAAAAALVVVLAVLYYRRIAVPHFEWVVREEQRRRTADLGARTASVHQIPDRPATGVGSAQAA